MTSPRNPNEFELSEEFQQKYDEIIRIYIRGKNLILEHLKGALIIAPYDREDIFNTIKRLRETLIKNQAISPDSRKFYRNSFGNIY